MNFLNYPSSSLLPQYHSTIPFIRFQPSPNLLKIPPFPPIPIIQSLNTKRPSTSLAEERTNVKAIPTKKIKMDSLNMLLKPTFAERDPYHSSEASVTSFDLKENDHSRVSYTKLNDQLLTENHITINWPAKSVNALHAKPEAIIVNTSTKTFGDVELNTKDVETRNREVSLCSLICQKLEQNCHELINQMQGILAMSQDLKREGIKIPQNFEDTQPGTPNTIMSEAWWETKSHMETQRSHEEHEEINEENELKVNSPVSERLKMSEEVQIKVKKPVRKQKKTVGSLVQSVMFNEKKDDSGRKMNRVQMLRVEREEFERQWAASDESKHIQKIILSRVGENYQAEIPVLDAEKRSQTRTLKIMNTPEVEFDEQGERENIKKMVN